MILVTAKIAICFMATAHYFFCVCDIAVCFRSGFFFCPTLFRGFSVTWISEIIFGGKKSPNLCLTCRVLAGSSSPVLKKQPPDRKLAQPGELSSQASQSCCWNGSCDVLSPLVACGRGGWLMQLGVPEQPVDAACSGLVCWTRAALPFSRTTVRS